MVFGKESLGKVNTWFCHDEHHDEQKVNRDEQKVKESGQK